MESNHHGERRFAVVSFVSLLFFSACAAPAPKVEEAVAQEPLPLAEAAAPAAAANAKAQPPKIDEVREAVGRVFKDAAVISDDQTPFFASGDFNGDRATDLAVFLRPAPGKVAEINQEYPAWILKNPFVIDRPGAPLQRVNQDETLLAVIHGYGANGWRDPEARQTFLLKSAAGANIQAEEQATVLKANQGKKLPRLRGDVIREVLKGKPGWLYYAESTYRWYDPETFRPEPERRVVHPGFSAQATK